jgi:RNA polymerase sigma-70 factor (ECF subfamily)
VTDLTALVDRCREGDQLAWEGLVRRFQGRVYSLAFHYLRDADEARDASQETFIRVYNGLERYSGETFVPWLLRIARNCCLDRLRRKSARPPASDLRADQADELQAPGPSPEESLIRDASQAMVYRAMAGMSERGREIILLKEIQGLTFPQIAEMLEQPVGTVKSRSNRARLELAKRVLALEPSYGANRGTL